MPPFVPKYREPKNDISGGTLAKFVIRHVAGVFYSIFELVTDLVWWHKLCLFRSQKTKRTRTLVKNRQKLVSRIAFVCALAVALSACSTYTCPTYASVKGGKGKTTETSPVKKRM